MHLARMFVMKPRRLFILLSGCSLCSLFGCSTCQDIQYAASSVVHPAVRMFIMQPRRLFILLPSWMLIMKPRRLFTIEPRRRKRKIGQSVKYSTKKRSAEYTVQVIQHINTAFFAHLNRLRCYFVYRIQALNKDINKP